MGVPRIKIYELPPGFTEDASTDIQSRATDELLPFVAKLAQLSDVKTSTPLVGAILTTGQALIPFNQSGGTSSATLVANIAQTGFMIAQSLSWTNDVLWEPLGVLTPIIHDSSSVLIPSANYTLTTSGVKFVGTAPVGATISFYRKAALGATNTFALVGDTFYRGANATWNRLLLSKNGAEYQVTTMPADGIGYVTVTGVTVSLKGTYASVVAVAHAFIAEHPNWIGGHLGLWPDVFVGTFDYPGDQYTDGGGTPIEPGVLPLFRDPGTYQANFRDGTLSFPEAIDSTATPVRANYSYLTGVANVTNQKLDAVAGTGNTQFKAVSEALFPDSHGKRWTTRNDQYTPFNVYVDGVLTPQPQSVLPYDTLTIKMA